MTSIWRVLLFLLAVLSALATTSTAHGDGNFTLRCHADQAATLLQLKKSFSFNDGTIRLQPYYTDKEYSLPSWQDGTDCCLWEGVMCGGSSGRVTALNLSGHGLYSSYLDPVIFNLTSLRFLDLSMNDLFCFMPAIGFERLTFLIHLNLSNSGLFGEVPIGIAKLRNLISLDLSSQPSLTSDEADGYSGQFNMLSIFDFPALMGNLSHLRELHLDNVQIYSSEEKWCKTLAKFVPRLQVLSLESCSLSGPIHESLSNLSSLTAINLQNNGGIFSGPFPEFFMDFVNLSVLQLAGVNLQGWFPRRIFQSEKLRVLDLSSNVDLSGIFPNISNSRSFEALRLDETNFSYTKSSFSRNFESLQELALDGKFISAEFVSSISMPRSLSQLRLSGSGFLARSESIFLWIGNLKNLTSLVLNECDLSSMTPSSIGNLKNLKSLRVHVCNVSISVLSAIGNLKDLQRLFMHGCRLHGSMPSASFGNLTNLRRLQINHCDFQGPIPSSIGDLVNLRNLYISSSGFTGRIPSAIGNLNMLTSMKISHSKLSGPIPSTVGNLSALTSMVLYDCGLSGPIPFAIGKLKKLTSLWLRGNNFVGRIPNSVGNLTRLFVLDLLGSMLSGEIPTSLFSLPVLHVLSLGENQLSGHIKEFDAAVSCLVSVELDMNELTGKIPHSFFEVTSLEYLHLSSNNLVGLVDLTSFWKLARLRSLKLSNNKLSVMGAEGNYSSSAYPSGLQTLWLARCNMSQFPIFSTHPNNPIDLDLSCNKLSGNIPNWIWGQSLSSLNLSHNMFTGMLLISSILPNLKNLDLSANRLQGQIPMPNSSIYLDYSHNNFSSVLPNFTSYLLHTTYLTMSNNTISGHLAESVCNSEELYVFDLSYNNFSGLIPSCLIENGRLAVLNLRENNFEGTLPSNVTSECYLQTIDLHGNKIEGQLPRSLSRCTYLEVLDIGNNQIVDTFPSWLGRLYSLYVLILRSNQFYGSIVDIGDHQSGGYFSSLQIIDLASNKFSGELSSEWFGRLTTMMTKFNRIGDTNAKYLTSGTDGYYYQDSVEITYKGSRMIFKRILTTLTSIDFSNNKLEGSIPESVGRLISLHVLNMSHNAFTGEVPAQLGGMTALESLDLSCNQLSGEIPQELANLTFLSILNLSDNQLAGRIPQSRQFLTFDGNSFKGNLGLCGLPLSNPCGTSPAPPSAAYADDSSGVDMVLFLFSGLGFGLGFAAAILMRWG